MMLPMLGIGCASLSKPEPVDLGQFPPCIMVTAQEVEDIRSLTKYRTVEDTVTPENKKLPVVTKEVKESLVKRDGNALRVLGAMAQWCQAYHERIGYEEPSATPAK